MREKIVEIVKEPDISCYDWELGKTLLANWKAGLPDQIIERICEEIEKVENPYFIKDIDGGYYNKYPEFAIFEETRQGILTLLRK